MLRYKLMMIFAGAFLPIALAGCGGGGKAEKVEVFPVKGKVTFSGAPVADASVIFSPVGSPENRPVATGRTNDKGEYSLTTYELDDGAAAGDYVVLVSKTAAVSASPESDAHSDFMKGGGAPGGHGGGGGGNQGQEGGSLLPEKYSDPQTSDLKVTVKSGDNDPFELTLKP